MSQSFIFWKQCWIYLRKSEFETMKLIIHILREEESISFYNLVKRVRNTIKCNVLTRTTNNLKNLLCARIVQIQQHGEVRVCSLMPNWEEKLQKSLTPFISKRKFEREENLKEKKMI